jgi:hypothetical protein
MPVAFFFSFDAMKAITDSEVFIGFQPPGAVALVNNAVMVQGYDAKHVMSEGIGFQSDAWTERVIPSQTSHPGFVIRQAMWRAVNNSCRCPLEGPSPSAMMADTLGLN